MSNHVDGIVRAALVSECETLLAQCSPKQVELFGRIFPGGLKLMPIEKLKDAVDLCHRTVKKNQADPARMSQ